MFSVISITHVYNCVIHELAYLGAVTLLLGIAVCTTLNMDKRKPSRKLDISSVFLAAELSCCCYSSECINALEQLLKAEFLF